MKSTLTKNQKRIYRADYHDEHGDPCTLVATVRYDDECGNGHNTFAVTGDLYEKHVQRGEPTIEHKTGKRLWLNACGCLHDEIAKHIQELAPFIKWHLTSSEGPMHYAENTLYHALEHGPTMAWVYFDDPANGIKRECVRYCKIAEAIDMCTEPSKTFNYTSRSGYRYEVDAKTAKVANLDHARGTAIWPEATPEQLRDKDALLARLPGLMREFYTAVRSLGFEY